MLTKKQIKKFLPFFGLLLIMLFVTGCSTATRTSAPTGGFYGLIYHWISLPLQNIMLQLAHWLGGENGAGWAIIIITIIVRLILLPLMLGQQTKAVRQQEKMAQLNPQMELIQKAMKEKNISQAQQMQLAQLQRQIYSANNVSLVGGIGCLPLIIQFPIMIGIYQAVQYSHVLTATRFFGISLAQKSLLLGIVATLLTFLQSYLSLVGVPESQKKQMQATMYASPIMTLFIAISFSGALALYLLAGALVSVLQQLIVTYIIMPKTKVRVAKELEQKPIQQIVTPAKIKQIMQPARESTNTSPENKNNNLHADLRKRNQGKQHRHK